MSRLHASSGPSPVPSTRFHGFPRRRHCYRLSTKAVVSLPSVQLHGSDSQSDASASGAWDPADSDLGWKTDFHHQYVRGKLIGQGSFGSVHMGVHKSSGLEVAVKTLPKIRGKLTKEKTLEKIIRETDMMERLQGCKGVIQLSECYEDEHNVHLVTEFCAGGDLQKYVEAYGALEEKALALVAFEVLKIVKACHDAGILHGDVKPANFCLKDKMRNPFYNRTTSYLKAIDFGCSQLLTASRRFTKRTGTPVFMSPEIFARDYAEKADIWSIGVMLYWLFSQRFPFFQNAEVVKAARLEEVADAVSNTEIKYDYGPWPNMTLEGVDFIQRCLTRPEDQRINISEALRHPWFSMYVPEEERAAALKGAKGPSGTSPAA